MLPFLGLKKLARQLFGSSGIVMRFSPRPLLLSPLAVPRISNEDPQCTNNNDGNKSGPHRAQRFPVSGFSPTLASSLPLFPLSRLLIPTSGCQLAIAGGGRGAHRRATEGRVAAGHRSRLILAGLTPRHVLRIKLLFRCCIRVHRYGKGLALAIRLIRPYTDIDEV